MDKQPSIVTVACALDALRLHACNVYEKRFLASAMENSRCFSCEKPIRTDYDKALKALQVLDNYFGYYK